MGQESNAHCFTHTDEILIEHSTPGHLQQSQPPGKTAVTPAQGGSSNCGLRKMKSPLFCLPQFSGTFWHDG